jgi:hypothetical protein
MAQTEKCLPLGKTSNALIALDVQSTVKPIRIWPIMMNPQSNGFKLKIITSEIFFKALAEKSGLFLCSFLRRWHHAAM